MPLARDASTPAAASAAFHTYALKCRRSRAWRSRLYSSSRAVVGSPPGVSPYTPGTAMSALASTLVRLGDGETAEQYARHAVALHNVPGVKGTLFEDRGNATLNLGMSLIVCRQPEPEEAARLGSRRSPSPTSSEPRPSARGRWNCVSCWTPGARPRRSRSSPSGSASTSCPRRLPDPQPRTADTRSLPY
jgi:hypothetical protein